MEAFVELCLITKYLENYTDKNSTLDVWALGAKIHRISQYCIIAIVPIGCTIVIAVSCKNTDWKNIPQFLMSHVNSLVNLEVKNYKDNISQYDVPNERTSPFSIDFNRNSYLTNTSVVSLAKVRINSKILKIHKFITNFLEGYKPCVVFTGFALGGSCSQFLAQYIAEIHPDIIVKCVSFGAPGIFNKEFIQSFNKHVRRNYSFYFDNDRILKLGTRRFAKERCKLQSDRNTRFCCDKYQDYTLQDYLSTLIDMDDSPNHDVLGCIESLSKELKEITINSI